MLSRIAHSLLHRVIVTPELPDERLRTARSLLFLQFEQPLGTGAIATATLRRLKAARPDLKVAVAAAGAPLQFAEASPFVDEVFASPSPLNRFHRAMHFALTQIRPRRREFDAVLMDTGNRRTRVAAYAVATGIAARRGFNLRPELLHSPLQANPALGNIDNNLRLLEPFGIAPETTEPAIHFHPADLDHAESLLPSTGDTGDGPRIAMITQSSRENPNEWFDERFVELSRHLIEAFDARLLFVGTATDASSVEALRARIGAPTRSLAGRTSARQLAAALATCDLAVTIDTGGLHVARGVDLPAVILANAAQPDYLWLPPGDHPRFHILRKGELPCAVCWRYRCATRECMREIEEAEVFSAVSAMLKRFPPSTRNRRERVAKHLAPR